MNVVLATRGRKSGKPREVRLYAYEDRGRLVIVGSRGGSRRDPAWAWNLRADPRATVKHGKHVEDVRAREATGKERDRLWKLVTAAFPLYERFQSRTTRSIPLFVLEPDSTG